MPDSAPLIADADAVEGASSSLSRCATLLVTIPLGFVFSIFLIFPFLILYALYFSFLHEAIHRRYLDDGTKVSGTVISRFDRTFIMLSPTADEHNNTQEGTMLEIQYTSPESNDTYKIYEPEPMLGECCTIGQVVELIVLPGYPRSARYGDLTAYDTTQRWVALILATFLPISAIMTWAPLIMRSSDSSISLFELIGNYLPWWSISAVVAVSFIIAFAMFRHWFGEVITATLNRGRDLNYVPPQRSAFHRGIHFMHYTGPASYPILVEAMLFGVAFTCVPLFYWLLMLLGPPMCIYMALYFTWRDHFASKAYLTKGVPIGAVVTEARNNHYNAIAYTYNNKNYKIYQFKRPDQDYHLGEQVQVLVLPDDPTAVRLLRYVQREKTLWRRLLCHTFPLLVLGGFWFFSTTVVYIPRLLSKDASLENINPIVAGFAIVYQFAVAFPFASYQWNITGAHRSTVMEVSDNGKVATEDSTLTAEDHSFV